MSYSGLQLNKMLFFNNNSDLIKRLDKKYIYEKNKIFKLINIYIGIPYLSEKVTKMISNYPFNLVKKKKMLLKLKILLYLILKNIKKMKLIKKQ